MRHRAKEREVLRVSDLLNRDSVMLRAETGTVQETLDLLVDLQESNGIITNGTAYHRAVCEREFAGGSTAIGDGLALPHACTAGVAASGIAALTLRYALDWGAADGQPVDVIFMIAVPPEQQSEHLLIMARLVNLLCDPILVRDLRRAVSREDFILRLSRAEAERFA